jgi:hypothetical protein
MEASGGKGNRRRGLRVVAILVVAIGVSVVVWLVVRNRDENGTATPTGPVTRAPRSSVARTRPQSLRTLSRLLGQPIYWAGPEPRRKLELTRSPSHRVYIRYLPLNVAIGDRRGTYLIVGTYRVKNAYAAIKKASREPSAHLLRLRGGMIGVYNDSSPTNVYFAAPHSAYQVEVYDPSPKRALALVRSGLIRPIGAKSARR